MKQIIFVRAPEPSGDGCRVCWYAGTSDQMVEKAIRLLLHIPSEKDFLLRDSTGDLVPVSGVLPANSQYEIVILEQLTRQRPATAAKQTTASERPAHCDSTTGNTTIPSRSECVTIAPSSIDSSIDGSCAPASPRRRKRLRPMPHATTSASLSSPVTASNSVSSLFTTSLGASAPPRPTSRSETLHEGVAHHGHAMASSRTVGSLINSFVETFTQAITTDDNVNFIPCSGRFSLFTVYCQVIPLPHFHPKTPEAFYKIASMQCKLDRQRIVRYYRVQEQSQANSMPLDEASKRNGSTTSSASHLDSSSVLNRSHQCRLNDNTADQVFQYKLKPHGKGPYLRKYIAVPTSLSSKSFQQLLQKASFLKAIGIAPHTALEVFVHLVAPFQPIAKRDFTAAAAAT